MNVPIGLIDNSVFYCKLKEYLNVTLNAVLVISHCLHFLNVLRKTITFKIIGNYVSTWLGLFSVFLPTHFSKAKSSTKPFRHAGWKTANALYNYSIPHLNEYHDLVTLAKSYVDVSFINVNSNRSQITQVNTTAAIKWFLIVSNRWSNESKLFSH